MTMRLRIFVGVSLVSAAALVGCAKNKKNEAVPATSDVVWETIHCEAADRDAPVLSPADTAAEETVAEETVAEEFSLRERSYEAVGAPVGTDALAAHLRVLHVDTLPDVALLAEDEANASRLRFLASEGELLVERQRALTFLVSFPSIETRALLLSVASDEDVPVALRVAALRSLLATMDAGDAEAAAVIEAARQSENARIRSSVQTDIATP